MLDWSLGTASVSSVRGKALYSAKGAVLEIGFGTGLNLAHYPASVTALTGLDSETLLEDRVCERIKQSGLEVKRVQLDASGVLPFPDDSFDNVVTTFTLCSISRVSAALSQMRRVLRPDGTYLFLEHGRSQDLKTAKWQDRINPIQNIIGAGCNLNRPIDEIIRSNGFRIEHLERFLLPDAPRLAGEMYMGSASKSV